MTQIQQTLLEIVRSLSTVPADSVGTTGNLLRDYGLDSLKSVELMAALENKYGVVFGAEPEDMDALASIEHLATWVAQRSTHATV